VIDFDVETDGLQPWSGKQRAFLYQFGDDTGLVEVLRPETDGERTQWWFRPGDEEGIRAVGETVPLGRMAVPDDIADVCLFLASPLARYVTGSQVLVHGGGERPSYIEAAKGTDKS